MKLVAPLPCLENIVRLVWVDHAISPAVLPSKSPQLASVVFRSFVTQAPDVVPGSRVDGYATEIINGVSVSKDNIAVSVCVLLPAMHSVAVSVNERKPTALVDSPN